MQSVLSSPYMWDPPVLFFTCSLAKQLLELWVLLVLLWCDPYLGLPALAMQLNVYNAALALNIWEMEVTFNRTLKLGKHFLFRWFFSSVRFKQEPTELQFLLELQPTLFPIFCLSVNHSLEILLSISDYVVTDALEMLQCMDLDTFYCSG